MPISARQKMYGIGSALREKRRQVEISPRAKKSVKGEEASAVEMLRVCSKDQNESRTAIENKLEAG